MNNRKNNWFTTAFSTVVPNQIDDNSPATTTVKLWIAFGVGIWLIVVATGLAFGYGVGTEVFGIPTEIVWLVSGLVLIIIGITRIGLRRS